MKKDVLPKKGTAARWMIDAIKASGAKGIEKRTLMQKWFKDYFGRDYHTIEDRGWYSSYFAIRTNYWDGSINLKISGYIPKLCHKIPGTNRWIFGGGLLNR